MFLKYFYQIRTHYELNYIYFRILLSYIKYILSSHSISDQSYNSINTLNKGKFNKFENKLSLNRVKSTLLLCQNSLNKSY